MKILLGLSRATLESQVKPDHFDQLDLSSLHLSWLELSRIDVSRLDLSQLVQSKCNIYHICKSKGREEGKENCGLFPLFVIFLNLIGPLSITEISWEICKYMIT